jgi:hypothetical protein
MNPAPQKPSAVENEFDAWAEAVAHGLTRRNSLPLPGCERVNQVGCASFCADGGSTVNAAFCNPC